MTAPWSLDISEGSERGWRYLSLEVRTSYRRYSRDRSVSLLAPPTRHCCPNCGRRYVLDRFKPLKIVSTMRLFKTAPVDNKYAVQINERFHPRVATGENWPRASHFARSSPRTECQITCTSKMLSKLDSTKNLIWTDVPRRRGKKPAQRLRPKGQHALSQMSKLQATAGGRGHRI